MIFVKLLETSWCNVSENDEEYWNSRNDIGISNIKPITSAESPDLPKELKPPNLLAMSRVQPMELSANEPIASNFGINKEGDTSERILKHRNSRNNMLPKDVTSVPPFPPSHIMSIDANESFGPKVPGRRHDRSYESKYPVGSEGNNKNQPSQEPDYSQDASDIDFERSCFSKKPKLVYGQLPNKFCLPDNPPIVGTDAFKKTMEVEKVAYAPEDLKWIVQGMNVALNFIIFQISQRLSSAYTKMKIET